MSDDKRKKKEDSKRISLQEPYEVKYWTKELGCTPVELADIVHVVGDSASAVRTELKRRRKTKS